MGRSRSARLACSRIVLFNLCTIEVSTRLVRQIQVAQVVAGVAAGVALEVVLVVVLRAVPGAELDQLSLNAAFPHARPIDALDDGRCAPLLLVVGVEDCGAVLRADVVALRRAIREFARRGKA